MKESTLVEIYGIWRKRKPIKLRYGIEDPEKLRNDRTFNPAECISMKTATCNFMIMKPIIIGKIIFNCIGPKNGLENGFQIPLYIIQKGKGYFEQYKEDEDLTDYNLPAFNGNSISDLVRKRWLDNDFWSYFFIKL